MTIARIYLLFFGLLLSFTAGLASIYKENSSINSRIVAYVGDEIITEYDLDSATEVFVLLNKIDIPIDRNLKIYILKDIIKRTVLISYFKNLISKVIKKNKSMEKNIKIDVSETEVAKIYQDIAEKDTKIKKINPTTVKKILYDYLLLQKIQYALLAPQIKVEQQSIIDYLQKNKIEDNKESRKRVYQLLFEKQLEQELLKTYNKATNHIAVEIRY